ncbi:MAG: NlpC/P60 family protein [Muribaculaceae bacterium]|nr:NlpC/P60 family protein [Muribaculaceae bacterium]
MKDIKIYLIIFSLVFFLSLDASSARRKSAKRVAKELVPTRIMQDNSAGKIQLQFADSLLNVAYSFTGYRYGFRMPGFGRFDCSGFTTYVFSQFGISLNRSSRGQFTNGNPITTSALLPGDLVFFGGSRYSKAIGHVGIVVSVSNGGFNFIHASRTGIRVSKYPQEDYYSQRYVGARRILDEFKPKPELKTIVKRIESGDIGLDVDLYKKPHHYNLNFENVFSQ